MALRISGVAPNVGEKGVALKVYSLIKVHDDVQHLRQYTYVVLINIPECLHYLYYPKTEGDFVFLVFPSDFPRISRR